MGLAPLLPSPSDYKAHPPAWLEDARSFIKSETGVEPLIAATETQEEAAQISRDAANRNVPLVIAAGGDGTLRTVAQEIAGSQTALGIVPKGTVNVFARELSIPLNDTFAALRIAIHGRTRHVDLGCFRTLEQEAPHVFLLMASLGIDAIAVENTKKEIKDAVGAPAYVLAGLSSLANFVPSKTAVTVHGCNLVSEVPITHVSEPFAVLMMNSGLYGGDFRVTSDALLDDGLLNAFIFNAVPGQPAPLQRATFVKQFGLAAIGQYQADSNIHHVMASRLEITCEPEMGLQVDGDSVGMQSRFIIEVMPRALAVRC